MMAAIIPTDDPLTTLVYFRKRKPALPVVRPNRNRPEADTESSEANRIEALRSD